MKKIKQIITFIFIVPVLFFSCKILYGQFNRITLDAVIEEIPDLWWEGGWDKTLELQQFIRENPADKQACARAQFWIACNHYANRDYERAIREYETVLRQYPEAWGECAKACFETGQIYLYRLYQYDNALESFRKVLSGYPECEVTAEAQRSLAYTYSLLKDNEKARQEYEKVWTLYPKFKLEVAKAYFENGELLFREAVDEAISGQARQQKLKDALSSYKKAYLYCPADNAEVAEWIIDAIIRAFRFLDGNAERANAFIRYQRSVNAGDSGPLSVGHTAITDPLAEF